MDLRLTQNQQLLVDSAQRFFTRGYPLDRMREIYLLNDEFDPALWSGICELGWNAAALPETVGGFDGGLVEAMLLLTEMGRGGCLTPYPHSSVAAARAMLSWDAAIAAAIANSEMVVIPIPMQALRGTVAVDGKKLSVRAAPIAWAQLATHFLCETDEHALLVAVDQPSVEISPVASSRGESLFEVRLESAPSSRIAPAAVFDAIRSNGAFACAALLQGIAERSLELAVQYAKERIQFGRPIGSFQAIQHKAADMRIATDVGRVLVMRAAAEKESARFSAAASKAKAWNSDAARKVTREAMQIFGGVSFAGDHVIQLM
jgi:alkylation response protein AidB-like acyl-CoA dehydrogenase